MQRDRKRRSIVKSITWRIIGIAIMPVIIYLVYRFIGKDVGNVALWSTVIFHGIRIVLYYYHERAWEGISWGRRKDDQFGETIYKPANKEDEKNKEDENI